MNHRLNNFRQTTSWMTTGLLLMVVTTFGVFAQTHASEAEIGLKEIPASISTHALQLLGTCETKPERPNNIRGILYR